MWKTMDEATLKSKKVVELKEIAKTFGLEGYGKMKKAEARALGRFVKRGGKVVIVADTEKKRAADWKVKGAVKVDSYGKVLDELIAPSGMN